jgi:hypothetical protein
VPAYGIILGHRQALGAILAGGMAFTGMLACTSGTPFLYIQFFGVAHEHYGYWFGLNVVGQLRDGSAVPMAAVVAASGILSWSTRYLEFIPIYGILCLR